tara:strand:+ start:812 stop:970 length:159 start_codon:yes stop_codon:yes gene_type:complete
MTKQFLQETNFEEDSDKDQDPIEFRAQEQMWRMASGYNKNKHLIPKKNRLDD